MIFNFSLYLFALLLLYFKHKLTPDQNYLTYLMPAKSFKYYKKVFTKQNNGIE